MSFDSVKLFEETICEYFGAPYGIAVDCCTHGLELCLRHEGADSIQVPKNTYLSVPMLASKLSIDLFWKDEKWEKFYYITDNIIDAAVLWQKKCYIPNTYMVVSFQYKKHLSLGRGGIILTDNKQAAKILRSMAYDGRTDNSLPWAEQNITNTGYHYYMTPETAQLGIYRFHDALCTKPKVWSWENYPDLTTFKVFNNG